MFNSKYKKEALQDLKNAVERYDKKYKSVIGNITIFHDLKVKYVDLIKKVEEYFNSIADKPNEFDKIILEIRENYKNFEKQIEDIEREFNKGNKIGGGLAGAGVAAGVGVAAFGPSAAMAIATTFGTASTGTAIASLSGAAATNAALAWLGGGALAAGGGGMAAGSAFLGLAGPIGWAIGGTALLGGGLLANSKNKKVAKEAEEKTRKVKKAINELDKLNVKIDGCKKEIMDIKFKLEALFNYIQTKNIRSYEVLRQSANNGDSDIEQCLYKLKSMLNLTYSLSSKINEKVN